MSDMQLSAPLWRLAILAPLINVITYLLTYFTLIITSIRIQCNHVYPGVCLFVCLSVCEQDYMYSLIATDFHQTLKDYRLPL